MIVSAIYPVLSEEVISYYTVCCGRMGRPDPLGCS